MRNSELVMAAAPPRWGYTSSMLAVLVGLAVWLLQQVGWLEPWNAVFYDRILSWTSRWRDSAPKVLTVRIPREDAFSDVDGIQLLESLHDLGAKAIVFNFLPAHTSRRFYERAVELQTVVFGRELRPDPDNPDTLTLEPWPAAARDLELAWGVVYLHPGLRGVYRWHQADVMLGQNPFPTIEMRAATLPAGTPPRSPQNQPFLVSFEGGPGSIPNLSSSRVLAGDLIPELVRGKWVIVGASARLPGLHTPLCSAGQTMTLLEFEANAMQTLIDGTALRPLAGAWTLLLLIALGIVSATLYPRVTSAAGLRVVLGVLLACGAAAVAAMVFFGLWIPLGALIMAQTIQFAFSLVLKTRLTNRALTDMRLRALKQIRGRFSLSDSQLPPEYWDQLADMIKQTLDVERMVLFERVPQTPQLKESKTFNCVFEEVHEKARSLEAPVFSEALAKGVPVRSQGFFTAAQVTEHEFLCPLAYAGELFGVWAVAIDPAKGPTAPALEAALSQFSQQIARLLYHRQRVATKRTLTARLKAWFSTEKQDQTYQELKTTADSLEQYYNILETVFSEIGSAMIVYDFFGGVLKANGLAVKLLRPENLSPARATALEFLRLVAGKDDSQVRRLLRAVLLERSPVSLPIKLPSQGDRQFLLRLNPLSEPEPARPTLQFPDVRGMVCELIETTSLSTLASLKGLVADRLGVELRDHLAAIEMSASLLESDSFSTEDRQMALEAIHQKTGDCIHVISECQKYLGRDVDAHMIQCFPVEALELLSQVCAKVAPKAAERHVTLKIEGPQLMAQVLASTEELVRLFSAIIELLLNDSAENTALTVEVEDVRNLSSFRFVNCGFGIPNERLQTILASSDSPAPEGLQVLRQAAVWVRNWGGSLEVSSDVGKGYSVTMRLRQFQLTSSSSVPTANEPSSVSGSEGQESVRSPLEA